MKEEKKFLSKTVKNNFSMNLKKELSSSNKI